MGGHAVPRTRRLLRGPWLDTHDLVPAAPPQTRTFR